MNWQMDGFNCYRLIVQIRGCVPQRQGHYDIRIQGRPAYCDRGDWIIYVDGENNDIDAADGFPRYFFGSIVDAQRQMETWLNRRTAYLDRPR